MDLEMSESAKQGCSFAYFTRKTLKEFELFLMSYLRFSEILPRFICAVFTVCSLRRITFSHFDFLQGEPCANLYNSVRSNFR